MNNIVGQRDILFVTLDTLRFDVAQRGFETGRTPNLADWLPATGWQRRHAPANFTYAAHHAFFSGFFPTEIGVLNAPRLFATEFLGSTTTVAETYTFKEATIVQGLANIGYQTHCIGGVGFFNRLTALGCVLPDLFQHSYWSPELGVTCRESPSNQVNVALEILERFSKQRTESTELDRCFLFLNVAALHQPNCIYTPGASVDTADTQLDALAFVDQALGRLLHRMQNQGRWFVIVCADHGTAYGEDGLVGHRLNHPTVGDVPYSDFIIN